MNNKILKKGFTLIELIGVLVIMAVILFIAVPSYFAITNSIKERILKKLFMEYKILGKIDFNLYYNFLINKNYKCKKKFNKIKNEYLKIIKYI